VRNRQAKGQTPTHRVPNEIDRLRPGVNNKVRKPFDFTRKVDFR
jgi:hypothetical protein